MGGSPELVGTDRPLTIREGEEKIVLVEGRHDREFLGSLLEQRGISGVRPLWIERGNNFALKLRTLKQLSGYHHVQVVALLCDANGYAQKKFDPDAAFKSCCSALRTAKLPVPRQPAEFVAGPPRVGVYILPKPGEQGMLETLCRSAVKDDVAAPCIEQYLKCLTDCGHPVPAHHCDKAWVQAFLASREEPGEDLVGAAYKKYFNFDSPAWNDLVKFLEAM